MKIIDAKIASLKRLSWEIPIETNQEKKKKLSTSKIKERVQLKILQNKGIMREHY